MHNRVRDEAGGNNITDNNNPPQQVTSNTHIDNNNPVINMIQGDEAMRSDSQLRDDDDDKCANTMEGDAPGRHPSQPS